MFEYDPPYSLPGELKEAKNHLEDEELIELDV